MLLARPKIKIVYSVKTLKSGVAGKLDVSRSLIYTFVAIWPVLRCRTRYFGFLAFSGAGVFGPYCVFCIGSRDAQKIMFCNMYVAILATVSKAPFVSSV